MWTPSDLPSFPRARRARRLSFPALGLLALLALPAALSTRPAEAQLRPRPTATSAAASAQHGELRQSIQKLYEVLPVRGGLLLKPRVAKNGVKTVEITTGNIAINGETVNPSVVRAWLGEEASPVLDLAALPTAEQRQLFGLGAEAEGSGVPTPAPKASADLPKPPAADSGKSADKAQDQDQENQGASEPPAPPEAPTPPTPPPTPTSVSSSPRVHVGGGVRVEANEVVEDVVAVGGPVHVDGESTGDVTAIGGSVTINGKVGGGVNAIGGSVHLGPRAEVGGDVTSILGRIDAAPGATIHGSKTEVSPGEVITGGRHGKVHVDVWPERGPFHFFGNVFSALFLALLACLVLLVARPTVERLEARVIAEPWKALLVGFLSQIFFLPLLLVVTLVLVISIVGCALILLYPFLALALLIAGLVGFTAVAYRVGRLFESRFQRTFGSPYVALLLGIVAIEALSLAGHFIEMAPFMGAMALLLLIPGAIIKYCAWTVGFGAFVLDRWDRGFRRQPPYIPVVPTEPLPPTPPPSPAPVEPPREPWEPGS